MASSQSDVPERMLRRGRDVDPNFQADESLYLRCTKAAVHGDRLLPQSIPMRLPAFSVNRSKYSERDDVLLPDWPDHGIAVFAVGDVPTPLISPPPGGVRYDFKVEHVPEERSYGHSEVKAYKGPTFDPHLDINKTVKKQFRQVLSDRAVIARQPAI